MKEKWLSSSKFHKLSEEKQEEYLEDLQNQLATLYADIDKIMSHIWELDENYGQQTQEWINERPG